MFNNRLTLPALAVLSALVLAACGGGGGDSQPSVSSTPTPGASNSNTSSSSSSLAGNQPVVNGVRYISGVETGELSKLVVNGQTIDLSYGMNVSIGPAGVFNFNGEITGGSALTRFGNRTVNGENVVFAQGTQLTADMPAAGNATYIGKAVYGLGGKYAAGNSRASVDFAAKKIDVTITRADDASVPESLKFGGSITGNTFSGTQNGVETKGAFYGSQAAYMAGTFRNTANNANGAFSGARQ